LTDSFTTLFKKFVINNAKLNLDYNLNFLIKKKKKQIYYTQLYEKLTDKMPFKASRYNGFFLSFSNKYQVLIKSINLKFKLINQYIIKRYNFLLLFIMFYLNKIFLYFKLIFYNISINNNYEHYLLKLKILMCYMYYKLFLRLKKIKNKKKKIFKNIEFFYDLIYVYKRGLKR
jgi:hypothetical protein